MTIDKAKKIGFTHRGIQFGFIPVFVKDDGECLETVGKNVLWNILLSILVEVDILFEGGYSFNCWIEDKPM